MKIFGLSLVSPSKEVVRCPPRQLYRLGGWTLPAPTARAWAARLIHKRAEDIDFPIAVAVLRAHLETRGHRVAAVKAGVMVVCRYDVWADWKRAGSGARQFLSENIIKFGPRLADLSLQFVSGGYVSLSPFLTSRNPGLVALRKLKIADYSLKEDDLTRAITVFHETPSLTEVDLHVSPWTLLRMGYRSMPWKKLTSLTICGSMSIYDFCTVFFQCTQLRTARLTRIDVEYHRTLFADEWIDPPRTTFPQLTDLTLQFCGSEESDHPDVSFREAIDMMKLPQIQTLCLSGDPVNSQPFIDPFASWAANLRILCLSDVYADVEDVLSLLQKCSALEELTLSLREVEVAQLLRALCSNADNKRPLPHLTTFFLGYYPRFDGWEESLECPYTELGSAFSDLIGVWIKDSSRTMPFVSATLAVCDFRGWGDDLSVTEMFDLVKSRLEMLAKEFDAARKCRLVTTVLTEYAELSKLLLARTHYPTRVSLSTDTITPTTDPGPALFPGAAPGYSVIEPTLYDAPPSSSQASLPSPTTTLTSTSALPTPTPTSPGVSVQAMAPAIPYHPHPPLKRWPNDYTVSELYAGFHAIDALLLRAPSPPPTDPSAPSTSASSNTPSANANTDPASPPLPPPAQTTAVAMTQRTAFERVFGSRYVKSTVCRHRAVWRRAPPELRAEFERRGADMECALWGEFVRCVEGRAPAKGVGVGCSEGAAVVQHQQQQQQYKHQHQQQHQHQHQHQHHPQAKVSVQRPPGLADEPLMASLQSHGVDK
ncbi:hypothetical protein H0H81_012668 [Sphagnurus paluster]|uniref:Uncharacterized protein n=1 Tax=Sphagnurus paluster TaxID=117069 RepID=A0A9P7GKP9_9AGAR|nr:hypothetical protein H0H81_012668 [Sphagnurus paluster]